jgi:hypothetical protein
MREYVCMYVGLRRISTVSFGGEAAFRRKNWATAVLDGGRRRVRSGGAGEVVRRATTATGVGRYLRAATVLPVDRWRTWYPGGHTQHPPPPPFLPLPLVLLQGLRKLLQPAWRINATTWVSEDCRPLPAPDPTRRSERAPARARVGTTTVLYPESRTSMPVAECTVVWISFFFTKST